MKKIVRLWMLLVLALTLGLAISVTASADAPAIGGKSQWKVGDTITFDSHTYYFNKVNADDSSKLEMNPGTYTIATEGWNESGKWFNYMFKTSGAYYLHIRPVDYQSVEHPTPAGICLVSGEGTQASPYKFDLWYNNVVTKEEIERVSTVYAGEIFVDGESKMTWLYSTDLSNSEIVFQRLRECLSQTAFDGLVPAMTGETAAKGLAVSSDHQSEMGSGWKSAATVAGQYFTGTVGSEKSGNFYDENAVYKTAVDAHYAERKETYDTPLGFNKTIGSALSTTTDFVWENHNDVLTKKYTVTAKVEETTVIYTTVNVTTEPQSANVKTAPTANTLVYTGSAQDLVTAGTASGGTMQYALGKDATTAPTTGYTTSIPTGTNVGTYYVWYKAVGDDSHSDSAPACVTVTIKQDAKTLVYNGSEQPLVTAGEAEGGTMMYALGENAETKPAESAFTAAIPTGKDAGTYYVWYMVKGDEQHTDTVPACVTVEIAKKSLTVTADAKSKTQGEADPALTYSVDGLVGSDTVTVTLSREAGEDPGTYAINLDTVTVSDNYAVTFVPAALTINKKAAPAPSGGGSGGGGGGYYGGTVSHQPRAPYSDVVGAAVTKARDSSPERVHNIELACEKLDGIVLQPGETFSFLEAMGGLTAEAGFEVAPVNPEDEATAEMGGGVSQVASTLYTSSLFALLETVERGNHPFAVPFIQPGTDAYVTGSDDGSVLDLKFRNTRGEPIRISAKTRVDEARQVREIVIELQSALGSSDYMPIRFDNSWSGDQNAFLTETPYDLTRPGYRILLTHEEQQFTDGDGSGIRTLTHRKILDAAGMLVRDDILNRRLSGDSYAMDTYYTKG